MTYLFIIYFTGAFCEIEIDNCDLVYCENNGTCVTNITSYACVCPPKFTGKFFCA